MPVLPYSSPIHDFREPRLISGKQTDVGIFYAYFVFYILLGENSLGEAVIFGKNPKEWVKLHAFVYFFLFSLPKLPT